MADESSWPKFRCLRRYSCRTGVAGNLDLVRLWLWAVAPQLRPRKPRARNLAYPRTIDLDPSGHVSDAVGTLGDGRSRESELEFP